MIYFWLGSFVFFASAMKRPADGDLFEGLQKRQNQDQDLYPEVAVDFIGSLPQEIIQNQIVTFAEVSAILSLSMTSKHIHATVMAIFKFYYSDKQDRVYAELMASRSNTKIFILLCHALKTVWPTSTNCLDRFYLKDTLNALLAEAFKPLTDKKDFEPRHVPLPLFFGTQQTHIFHHVPRTPSCAVAALKSYAYASLAMSADLLLEVPRPVLISEIGHMTCLLELEPFKWVPENDPMLPFYLEQYNSLFDYERIGGLDLMPKNQLVLLKTLLEKGVETCIDYLMEDDTYRMFADYQPVLALMLEIAEPHQVQYIIAALKRIFYIHSFVRVLCQSKKLSDTVLIDLFEETMGGCRLKSFLIMIDCGRQISVDWLRTGRFEANRILSSYSKEQKKYIYNGPVDRWLVENTWFIAHAINLDDDQLIGLLGLFHGSPLTNLFFLSLQLGRSDAVIRKTANMMQFKDFDFLSISPQNIVIPNHILPHIAHIFSQGSDLITLIPDEKKFIDALVYLEKSDLWTLAFSLGSVLVAEMAAPRKNVLQMIMDLAAEKDFRTIATTALPFSFKNNALSGMFEYIMELPTEKLLIAVNASPLYQESPNILHMILKALMARPDGFVHMMCHPDPQMVLVIDELVYTAWCCRFPERKTAFVHRDYLDFYFFELIEEYSLERLEFGVFLYYVALKLLQCAAEEEYVELDVPARFNYRQMEITRGVLQTALKVISFGELTQLCARFGDPLISDLIQDEFTDRF